VLSRSRQRIHLKHEAQSAHDDACDNWRIDWGVRNSLDTLWQGAASAAGQDW
jgi:hypothetical protein